MINFKMGSIKMDHAGMQRTVQDSLPPRVLRCAVLVEGEAKRLLSVGGGASHVPSAPGQPPHAQTGELKSSITSAMAGPNTAIVGPNKIGKPTRAGKKYSIGHIHEFGGVRHPKRPFMKPALMRMLERFPEQFKGLDFRLTGARKT